MEEEICIGKALHMVGNQMKRLFDNAALEYGLTSIQSRIIRFLYLESQKRDVYQKDIEEEFNIRRSSVTSVLQLLEKKGYIKRVSVKDDKRLKKIILTCFLLYGFNLIASPLGVIIPINIITIFFVTLFDVHALCGFIAIFLIAF